MSERDESRLTGLSSGHGLRYRLYMSGFVEKTVAEQGFAASWNLHVGPLIEIANRRRHRQLLFGSLVTGLAAGLGVAALFLGRVVPPDSLFAQPLFMALVLALAALAAIASWVTMLRRDGSMGDAVLSAVESHFAALFTPDDNAAFAEVILQDLVSDGVLDPADHQVTAHHAGSYRGCRIRLISARARPQTGKRRRPAGQDLVVARISLPAGVSGRINIDTDRSRLPEDAASFHADHDQFDHIFGVTCGDRMATARLVTTQLAENLLMVQQRLANPLNRNVAKDPRVAVQIADGSLLLVVEEVAQDRDAAGQHSAGAESLARGLVMRFAAVPGLVDELHGDSDVPPAFASLAPEERSGPQISV